MRNLACLLCWLTMQTGAAYSQGARLLTVEVWSAHTVQSLRAMPAGNGNGALQVDWTASGLASVPRRPAIVRQLQLSGNYRLDAGGETVTAAGQWTIAWQPRGLRVLLTLPSERYVAAALNAEAAADEPLASLKAMAISIRTFGLVNAGRHHAQGFDLCDSTHCQALGFTGPRPGIERAVQETAGETLWFEGRRAHVYYTQHCGGRSAAAVNVWPRERAPYLRGLRADPYCVRRTPAEWHARISLAELSRIFKAEGWQTPSPITAITVTRRSQGGRAELLSVTGQGAAATLSASSFRFAVDRALGWNQVRSDWYSATVAGPALEIAGQGYGHGVGLCQAGAHEMAAYGRSYGDILRFYFPGAVTGISSTDHGWQRVAGTGWTLLSAGSPGELLAQGNAAWQKARALLGEPGRFEGLVVQQLPSTELFRQTTGQPGWMLASTRGSTVWLQPRAVVNAQGGPAALLLHEFLHVLVEQQAGPEAPLWLREGLVEALAAGDRASPPDLSASQVEAILAHPADAAVARHAHRVAAGMAQRLCDRYGLTAVKEFLRSGVPAATSGL